MSKKFRARGSDGLVAICEATVTEEQLDDPLSHLGNIHFHSDLEYMNALKVFTGTAVFPARSAEADPNLKVAPIVTLDTKYDLASHMAFGRFSDGQLINGFSIIQKASDYTYRAAGLCIYPGEIKLVDFYTVQSGSLPQISKDYIIYMLSWPDVEV